MGRARSKKSGYRKALSLYARSRISNRKEASRLNDDILLLIFQVYLEEPSTMPISLTPVCRQWYNLIHATPTLWSRIVLNVKSEATITPSFNPTSTGFLNYLSHTDGRDLPLDIEIRFDGLKRNHDNACKRRLWVSVCSSGHTSIVNKRQEEINALLTLLASVEPLLQHQKRSSCVPPVAEPKRIDRWRSLLIESNEYKRSIHTERVESWMENLFHNAPRLRYLTLRGVSTDYVPHKDFAPNLTNLLLEDLSEQVENPIINTPSIKTFSLQRSFQPIHWRILSGICFVEELSLGESLTTHGPSTSISLPNLKRLKLRDNVARSIVTYIAQQLSDSGRRLDVLHLMNVRLSTLEYYSKVNSSSILANTQKVVFEILPYLGSKPDPELHRLSIHDIKTFLEKHAPGAEIVVILVEGKDTKTKRRTTGTFFKLR